MTREALTEYSLTFLQAYPLLLPLVLEYLALDPVQFWLDCSTMPGVISAVQEGNEENVIYHTSKRGKEQLFRGEFLFNISEVLFNTISIL